MKGQVEKKCLCGHFEVDHKYRNVRSAEELLANLAADPRVTVIRDQDHMKPLGFKLDEKTYLTYDKALEEAEAARKNASRCDRNVFEKTCDCQIFRVDNLKYLEDLDERSTS